MEGVAKVGETLTAKVTPEKATVTYKWMRADAEDGEYVAIAGATDKTYTLSEADAGKWIKVEVKGTGNYTGTKSKVVGPVEVEEPVEPEPEKATLEATGVYGINDNKVYAGYELQDKDDTQIPLIESKIESISVKDPDGNVTELTVVGETDPYLWFNIAKKAGTYTYTVVTKGEDAKTYEATIDWNEPTEATVSFRAPAGAEAVFTAASEDAPAQVDFSKVTADKLLDWTSVKDGYYAIELKIESVDLREENVKYAFRVYGDGTAIEPEIKGDLDCQYVTTDWELGTATMYYVLADGSLYQAKINVVSLTPKTDEPTQSEYGFEITGADQDFIAGDLLEGTVIEGEDGVDTEGLTPVEVTLKATTINELGYDNVKVLAPEVTGEGTLQFWAYSADDGKWFDAAVTGWGSGFPIMADYDVTTPIYVFADTAGTYEVTFKLVDLDNDNAVITEKTVSINVDADPEQAAIDTVVAGTEMSGNLTSGITATFPETIPTFFDDAGYKINSEIVLAGNVNGTITITRGETDLVIEEGLDAGTYTYTELVELATGTKPSAADFTNEVYGGQVETYNISVSGNTAAIDTTVTIRSIISDDGFETKTVLAELVDLELKVDAEETQSVYGFEITGADQEFVVGDLLDATLIEGEDGIDTTGLTPTEVTLKAITINELGYNNVKVLAPEVTQTEGTSGTLQFWAYSADDGKWFDAAVHGWGSGFPIAADYDVTTPIYVFADTAGTYEVTFKLVDLDNGDAVITEDTVSITVVAPSEPTQSEYGFEITGVDQDFVAGDLLEGTVIEGEDGVDTEGLTPVEVTLKATTINELGYDNVKVLAPEVTGEGTLQFWAYSADDGKWFDAAVTGWGSGFPIMADYDVTTPIYVFADTAGTYEVTFKLVDLDNDNAVITEKTVSINVDADPEQAAIDTVVAGTEMSGNLTSGITATFPETIPTFFDDAGYKINSEIVLAGNVNGTITITRGETDLVIEEGLDAGTYTYTELVELATGTKPSAADFTNEVYGGQVETYNISVSGNTAAIDTTVTIRSIISDDGFETKTVLAELVDLELKVDAEETQSVYGFEITGADQEFVVGDLLDATLIEGEDGIDTTGLTPTEVTLKAITINELGYNNVKVLAPEVTQTEGTSGTLQFWAYSADDGKWFDAAVHGWGSGFPIAADYDVTTPIYVFADTAGTYEVTFKLVDLDNGDAVITEDTVSITVVAPSEPTQSEYGFEITGVDQDFVAGDLLEGTVIEGEDGVDTEGLTPVEVTLKATTINELGYDNVKVLAPEVTGEGTLQFWAYSADDGKWFDAAVTGWGSGFPIMADYDVTTPIYVFADTAGTYEVTFKLVDLDNDNAVITEKTVSINVDADPEQAAIDTVVAGTEMSGNLTSGITATFPETIPTFFDDAGYKINSEIVLAGNVNGTITITRGETDLVIEEGLDAGTYTYTELVELATGTKPSAADFTNEVYGGQVETYNISVSGNTAAIDTTVTIRSIISDDGFETKTVLAELVDLELKVDAEETQSVYGFEITGADQEFVVGDLLDATLIEGEDGIDTTGLTPTEVTLKAITINELGYNNVKVLAPEVTQTEGTSGTLQFWAYSADDGKWFDAAVHGWGSGFPIAADYDVTTPIYVFADTAGTYEVTFKLVDLDNGDAVITEDTVSITVVAPSEPTQSEYGFEITGVDQDFVAGDLLEGTVIEGEDGVDTEGLTPVEVTLKATTINELGYDNVKVLAPEVTGEGTLQFWAYSADDGKWFDAAVTGWGSGFPIMADYDVTTPIYVFADTAGTYEVTFKLVDLDNDNAVITEKTVSINVDADPEQAAIDTVVAGTEMSGNLTSGITATFPETIPTFFDDAGYKINSEIVLAGNVNGTITITRGETDLVIEEGLDAGTYTYTELVELATGTKPSAADFTNEVYGGQVETYNISVSGNTAAIDTTVTIRSIISDDGFETKTVLAELVDLELKVDAEETQSVYGFEITGADQEFVVGDLLDATLIEGEDGIDTTGLTPTEVTLKAITINELGYNNVKVLAPEVTQTEGTSGTLQFWAYSADDGKWFDAAVHGWGSGFPIAADYDVTTPIYVFADTAGTYEVTFKLVDLDNGDAVITEDTVSITVVAPSEPTQSEYGFEITGVDQDFVAGDLLEGTVIEGEDGVDTEGLTPVEVTLKATTINELGYDNVKVLAPEVTGEGTLQFWAYSADDGKWFDAAVTGWGSGFPIMADYDVTTPIYVFADTAGTYEVTFKLVDLDNDNAVITEKTVSINVDADPEQAAIDTVVAGTEMSGNLTSGITATFPETIPTFFDDAGYKINSEIVLAGNVNGTITITRGETDLVIEEGLDAGTYTYTELVELATGTKPSAADFTNEVYGGQVETYNISVSGNTAAIDTTVTIRSIISDDGFETKTVLAELVDLELKVDAEETQSVYGFEITGADQEFVVGDLLDATLIEGEDGIDTTGLTPTEVTLKAITINELGYNNVKVLAPEVTQTEGTSGTLQFWAYSADDGKWFDAAVHGWGSGFPIAADYDVTTPIYVFADTAGTYEVTFKLVDLDNGDAVITEDTVSITVVTN